MTSAAALGRRSQQGLILLAVVLMLALGALGSLVAVETWATTMKREREAQLLFVGDEYRRAIANYYRMSPTPIKTLPRSLEDLLEDRRFPMPVQHLRRLYPDPISGDQDWGLVEDGVGGIIGVHSTSEAATLKRGGFPDAYREFEAASKYSEWRFIFKTQPAVLRRGR